MKKSYFPPSWIYKKFINYINKTVTLYTILPWHYIFYIKKIHFVVKNVSLENVWSLEESIWKKKENTKCSTFSIWLVSIFNAILCFFHTFRIELSPFYQTSMTMTIFICMISPIPYYNILYCRSILHWALLLWRIIAKCHELMIYRI